MKSIFYVEIGRQQMKNWCNYMLGTTTILVHYSNSYSGVKKVQRCDFVYLPSLLYHPYLVYTYFLACHPYMLFARFSLQIGPY